jgi:hypothetical protein
VCRRKTSVLYLTLTNNEAVRLSSIGPRRRQSSNTQSSEWSAPTPATFALLLTSNSSSLQQIRGYSCFQPEPSQCPPWLVMIGYANHKKANENFGNGLQTHASSRSSPPLQRIIMDIFSHSRPVVCGSPVDSCRLNHSSRARLFINVFPSRSGHPADRATPKHHTRGRFLGHGISTTIGYSYLILGRERFLSIRNSRAQLTYS